MMAGMFTASPTLAIWRQPVAARRAAGSLWLSWFLLALSALGACTLAVQDARMPFVFAFFTAVPMGMLLLMWWFYLCSNVQAQCHPAALQLVPALRARTVRAVVLAWLAIVASMTLLAGVPTGYPVQAALVTALVLIELSFAGTWRALVLGAVVMLLPQILRDIGPWLGAVLATPAGVAGALVLVLVDGAAALRRLASSGTAASAAPARPTFAARLHGPGGRATGWLDRADRQPAFLQPLGRSWFSLHWSTAASVAVLCVILRFWAAWKGPAGAETMAVQRILLAGSAPCLLALLVYREAHRFARAHVEQALLCLTPRAPDGSAMNAMLAGLLVRGFARAWLVVAGLNLAALAFLDAPLADLARVGAVWVAALPLVAVPMRDFARAGGAPGLAATPLLTLLIGVASAAASGMGPPGLWLAVAGAGAGLACALAAWRGRAMRAAAPALPAARFRRA